MGSPARDRDASLASRRNSIISIDEAPSGVTSRSVSVVPEEAKKVEYERAFPSFFLHSHTKLAPVNLHIASVGIEQNVNDYMDSEISRSVNTASALDEMITKMLEGFGKHPGRRRAARNDRTRRVISVKNIIDRLHGTRNDPIDLTSISTNPLELLRSTPLKYLRYAEDVRPPYIGTYSKLPVGLSVSKLCRNPFTRALPAVNYDYDSEMEWQEPEEGEYLGSEDEEDEVEDDEGEDLEGFLDDEEAGADSKINKPKHVMGDLEPINTGLCWEFGNKKGDLVVQYGKDTINLNNFKIDVLLGKKFQRFPDHIWKEILTNTSKTNPPYRSLLDLILVARHTRKTLISNASSLSRPSRWSQYRQRPYLILSFRTLIHPLQALFTSIHHIISSSETHKSQRQETSPARPDGRFQESSAGKRSHESGTSGSFEETVSPSFSSLSKAEKRWPLFLQL